MARLEDALDFATLNSSELADNDLFYVFDRSSGTVKTVAKSEMVEAFGGAADAVSDLTLEGNGNKVLKGNTGNIRVNVALANGAEVGVEDGVEDGWVSLINMAGASVKLKRDSGSTNETVTFPGKSGTVSLQGELLTGGVARTITEKDDGAMIAQAPQITLPPAPTKAISFKWQGTDLVVFCASGNVWFSDLAGTITTYTPSSPFENITSPMALDFSYIGNRWVIKQIY